MLLPDLIQVSQEAGQVVWYSHLLQNFPQFIVIHTVDSDLNAAWLKKKKNQKPWARNTQPHHTWIPNLQKLRDKKCHWVLGYFVISQCVLQSLPFSHSQLFRTLKDCSPTDSPAHGDSPGPWGFSPPMGILQARTLEWVSTPSSRGSSPPRDRTRTSPALAGLFFIASTTWE